MQCFRCARPAVLYQRYSGRHLCSVHLCADIESRAKRIIRKNRWLVSGDLIGIVTRLPHSEALEIFLVNLISKRSDISLVRINPPQPVVQSSAPWYEALSKICNDAGITRIALPYCADDLAVETLADILRGDAASLLLSEIPGMCTPVMHPLQEIPAEELDIYVMDRGEVGEEDRMSYADPDHSNPFNCSIKNLLTEFSLYHPSAPHALRKYRDNLRDLDEKDSTFFPH